MGQPVVHFEIIGEDPTRLRAYYADLFDWTFRSHQRSRRRTATRPERRIFYVAVPDVESAARNEGGGVVVGHLTDPAGNLVGVAGPT